MLSELQELHIKGTLANKGLVLERFNDSTNELDYSLTKKGKTVLKEMIKDKELKREFILMAFEEAQKLPIERRKEFMLNAVMKLKELEYE